MQNPIPQSELKIKLILFLTAIIIGIIWLLSPDKEAQKERNYFNTLNFSMTAIVKQIIRTGDGGKGILYVKLINNNKGYDYETSYKGQYLFCKIYNDEAIVLSPETDEIELKDSIVINTNQVNKYSVYRKGVLVDHINPWLNDRDPFYNYLTEMGYLDFSYYHKNKVPIKKLSVLLF